MTPKLVGQILLAEFPETVIRSEPAPFCSLRELHEGSHPFCKGLAAGLSSHTRFVFIFFVNQDQIICTYITNAFLLSKAFWWYQTTLTYSFPPSPLLFHGCCYDSQQRRVPLRQVFQDLSLPQWWLWKPLKQNRYRSSFYSPQKKTQEYNSVQLTLTEAAELTQIYAESRSICLFTIIFHRFIGFFSKSSSS